LNKIIKNLPITKQMLRIQVRFDRFLLKIDQQFIWQFLSQSLFRPSKLH